MTDRPHIAIVGTGYVGLTTGACLAHLGFPVVCCDIDERKVAALRSGVIPIVEDGLGEIVHRSVEAGRLSFELGVDRVREVDVVFLCVPTPQDEDGSADLRYVREAASEIGPLLRPGAVVVNKSTVPVGSFGVVGETLARDDVQVVSNPEFLREGSAVHDFLHPDRVVIGTDQQAAGDLVASLYGSLDCEIVRTDPTSAELIKYAANGFLAMKISFVNSVAALCEHVGADVASVVDGIGSDRRIGRAFLNPGPGWGGSCFPKDSRALVSTADEHGYDFSLMRGVIDINEQQYERMIDKVVRASGRIGSDRLDGLVVGVLGLTFKAGTDDLRESPSLRVIDGLRSRGAAVRAYDPTTIGDVHPVHEARLAGLHRCGTPLDAAVDADVVVLLTEWPEFVDIDPDKLADMMRGDAVVDCRNLLDGAALRDAGLRYEGVGRS
ncbi:MAG: UDP-glucose/GDP-mannose dehydrogenase family protein [Ilumatobacter sp.]|uniref:UDP-glucose dehydrogenase family protein n=1 Tax=Ilumatobacter sp. TaxID=1967498 RepID=UPI00260DCFC5|nr:UDP-glucose/GDP-mannose dehydrogenase family protein [Ilumatobacter sp.]MDJ0768711.1 UDP-glucose/GDP-mannose dehydrogenase family protein [Ilumatobacter sp.]